LRHVTRKDLASMRERCSKRVYRKHQAETVLDEQRFAHELAGTILDWRGLTQAVLETLFPLKPGVDLGGQELPCTDANKRYMLEHAYDFDAFVIESVTDLERLREARVERETKNSSALSQPS